MRLSYDRDSGVFYLKLKASERHIPQALGFVVSQERKQWVTDDSSVAAKLLEHADASAREALNAASPTLESVVASHAADSVHDYPCPPGLSYLGYQKAGIEYANIRKDTLIADLPGLGKTIQAVGIFNTLPSPSNALLIVPASLKINWQREWEKWSIHSHLTVGIATGKEWPETDVVIVNYDILHKWHDHIRLKVWDLLVCDEAHALKTKGTRRTAHVLGGSYLGVPDGSKAKKKKRIKVSPIRADKRVFLSGTPILSRPVDLWPLAEACDPTGLGKDWITYTRRYCGAWDSPWGYDTSGASNLDELQQRLRSTFMIRRTKDQVLKELPPKRRQIIELPAEGAKRLLDREIAMYEQFSGLLEGVTMPEAPGEEAPTPEAPEGTYEEQAEKLEGPDGEFLLEEMALLRQEVALKKLPMVTDFVDGLLESGEKAILFAYHKAVIAELREKYPDAACISGAVPQHKRQDEVDRFQTDDTCRVFIGQIIAAGTGHTLTAASNVVFAELDWTPGNLEQCEDRAHRIGQEAGSVNVYHLVLEGSLDARMIQSILEKQDNIKMALG